MSRDSKFSRSSPKTSYIAKLTTRSPNSRLGRQSHDFRREFGDFRREFGDFSRETRDRRQKLTCVAKLSRLIFNIALLLAIHRAQQDCTVLSIKHLVRVHQSWACGRLVTFFKITHLDMVSMGPSSPRKWRWGALKRFVQSAERAIRAKRHMWNCGNVFLYRRART